MFTVRHVNDLGDAFYECESVQYRGHGDEGALQLYDGRGDLVALLYGGRAYVMNSEGKTVASYTLPSRPTPVQAQLVSDASIARHTRAMRRLADYRPPGFDPGNDGHIFEKFTPGGPDDPLRGSDEPPYERVTDPKTGRWHYEDRNPEPAAGGAHGPQGAPVYAEQAPYREDEHPQEPPELPKPAV